MVFKHTAPLILPILLLFFLHYACCRNIDCFTPPPEFYFEIVSKQSGENLFTNGALNPDNIAVKDEDNNPVEHYYIDFNDIIQLQEIGWNMELKYYQIIIDTNLIIEFILDMDEKHNNCCTYFEIAVFDVLNY